MEMKGRALLQHSGKIPPFERDSPPHSIIKMATIIPSRYSHPTIIIILEHTMIYPLRHPTPIAGGDFQTLLLWLSAMDVREGPTE